MVPYETFCKLTPDMYILDNSTKQMIKRITSELVILTPYIEPVHKSSNISNVYAKNKGKIGRVQTYNNPVILPVPVSIDHIKQLRGCLNKLTDKNYIAQKDIVLKTTCEPSVVSAILFDIASTNKFYASIYAQLFNDLLNKDRDVYLPLLCNFLTKYIDSIMTAECQPVDETLSSYEILCRYTKRNDKNRAIAAFIIGVITKPNMMQYIGQQVIDFMQQILVKIIQAVNLPNNIMEVEELAELVYIFAPETIKYSPTCLQLLTEIFTFNKHNLVSYSSRIMFKFQDLQKIMN